MARAKLIKMVRSEAEFEPPYTADVHPKEVKQYQLHGWHKAPVEAADSKTGAGKAAKTA